MSIAQILTLKQLQNFTHDMEVLHHKPKTEDSSILPLTTRSADRDFHTILCSKKHLDLFRSDLSISLAFRCFWNLLAFNHNVDDKGNPKHSMCRVQRHGGAVSKYKYTTPKLTHPQKDVKRLSIIMEVQYPNKSTLHYT